MSSTLHIQNSLSRKKEAFVPINPPYVGLYVCGPTVYNYAHLGNVRTFITFDIIYRYLTFLGYKVRYVRNITDVGHLTDDADSGEDKIAKKARFENKDPMEIVQHYTLDFHHVMDLFNAYPPTIEPTATGHLIEQIEMIKMIIDNGFAYEINGSVYFDVLKYNDKFGDYGVLSGRILDELYENTRENLEGQSEKKNPYDFALWKKADRSHIMKWPSPWGIGFPGWHLECSAMSTKYLGNNFDIHGGGMDLKFPHHECEIAQNVSSVGSHPVRYWMHGNMLTVNGQKMSKSLGNSFLPLELISGNHHLLEKGYSPMCVRFFMLQAHYSSTLDFTNEALNAAEKGYKRLITASETIKRISAANVSSMNVGDYVEKCYAAMNDDFNCPVLIATLFEGVNFINRAVDGQESLTDEDLTLFKQKFLSFIHDVLGLKDEKAGGDGELVDGLMQTIIDLRNEARAKKDFATSDVIRDKLKSLSIQIKDGKDRASWEKI